MLVVFSFLFLVALLIFGFLYFLFMVDSLRGHDLPTSKRAINVVSQIILRHKISGINFYDLGCGRGTLALAIKKKIPLLAVYALDKSALRIFFARLKNIIFFQRKVFFKKANIFKINLGGADIVYTYLWYDRMPPLEQKLIRELKKGAMVITNTSNFPNWKPQETHVTCTGKQDFEKLFVYFKN